MDEDLAIAVLDLGYCYHEGVGVKRDFKLAVRSYKIAAAAGIDKAQFNLALCHLNGEGVLSNESRGLQWLRKAARKKHAPSLTLLRKLREFP